MKKILSLLLACILCIFAGCSTDTTGKIIRYAINDAVTNLDPQFTTDSNAQMLILNMYEGLLVRGTDGTLQPGVAERYDVSTDGLTYTFILRENAKWADEKPVTAGDFVFALRRLFSMDGASKYAQDFCMIENARQILDKQAPVETLGVKALSAHELEIRLAHKSPFFPDRLAEPAAMPCNEDFFLAARGRYGLVAEFVHSNGPYYLSKWDNQKSISLRPNAHYASQNPAIAGGANIYIANKNISTDCFEASADALPGLLEQDYTAQSFAKTTWCIVFNPNSKLWGNPLLRQGFAHTVEPALLAQELPEKFMLTSLLVPPAFTLAGQNYRKLASSIPVEFDPQQGKRLFDMGLSALSLDSLPATVFYVPDSGEHQLAMGKVQQSWQKHLSAAVSVEPQSTVQIWQRYYTGDYSILLLPVTASAPQAEALLQSFAFESAGEYSDYQNPLYDKLLQSAAEQTSLQLAAEGYGRAESLLLQDAVVIPVYTETTAFVTAPSVNGLLGAPFSARLQFKYAEKNS